MKPPSSAEWLSTMRCNLRCRHCAASAGQPAEGELDTAEAERVLEQLSELQVKHLCISGGEFTLRDDWKELLAMALRRFPGVAVITNGWMGGAMIDAIEALPRVDSLTVMVSVDGMREVHDARRGSGAWDKAVELLSTPTRAGRDIITSIDVASFGELDAIARLGVEHKVRGWNLQPSIPLGRMSAEGFLGQDGLVALAEYIVQARKLLAGKMQIFTNHWFGYFHPMREGAVWSGCPAGRDQIALLAQGDVAGCVAVPAWVCGNVRTQSIREIWEGPRMQAVRNARPSGCDGCSGCGRGCEVMQSVLRQQFCWK
ncbi:MAG: radical SAM protein [Deltaproteobacteria bacterium]|nr:radical SAM protein [Deltaproteobacteria bacterium]